MRNNTLLFIVVYFILSFNSSFAQYVEGKHYMTLQSPVETTTGDKVEVRELFWYYCPHCFNIEHTLKPWVENLPEHVKFIRQPAVFSDRWINGAIFYYVLEELGATYSLHDNLFNAIHLHKTPFSGQNDFVNWLEMHGIDRDKANNAFKSASVRLKVSGSKLNTVKYHLKGVPAIIINGKYWTDVSLAGGEFELFKVADFLIEKESASPYKSYADFNDAVDAYKRGDYQTAFKEMRPLANQGDAVAQVRLGWMYAEGRGVAQDYKQAVRW